MDAAHVVADDRRLPQGRHAHCAGEVHLVGGVEAEGRTLQPDLLALPGLIGRRQALAPVLPGPAALHQKQMVPVGDAVEVEDFIFKDRTMVPLAGPANKQGRIAADNIAGGNVAYKGTQGSSVAKIFSLTAASTGANEKTLNRRGLEKGKDYETVIITQNSHAGYYPGAGLHHNGYKAG